MKICGVYLIKNLITNKVYVGSSVNIFRRWKTHQRELIQGKHHSLKLQRSFDKHGVDSFKYLLAESAISQEMATKCEQKWIIKFDSVLHGYNINPFANNVGLMPKSDEHKRKIGLAHLGRKLTEESKEKIRQAHLGKVNKPCSEETKLKMSLAKLGKQPMTVEGRQKLSEFRKSTLGKKRGPYKPRDKLKFLK